MGITVNGIAIEIPWINLGGVNLNDGPVLAAAATNIDGRREDDMA